MFQCSNVLSPALATAYPVARRVARLTSQVPHDSLQSS